MSIDPKTSGSPPAPVVAHQSVKIFTYPKIVFMIPTMIAALVCGFGMLVIQDDTRDPAQPEPVRVVTTAGATAAAPAGAKGATATRPAGTAKAADAAVTTTAAPTRSSRFSSTQNLLGIAFLTILGLNLLIMSVDFPRFTVIALFLFIVALCFFVLWLNVYFELLPPLVSFLENVYAVANAQFYILLGAILAFVLATIWVSRYLDYWEVLPNELLHNHGPFSDLERFPTMHLKFDKEIPDILEYALLRSGRLVLHIPGQSRAIVLDNVLWINHKEQQLKRLLSRMEVRVTTDQETIPGT